MAAAAAAAGGGHRHGGPEGGAVLLHDVAGLALLAGEADRDNALGAGSLQHHDREVLGQHVVMTALRADDIGSYPELFEWLIRHDCPCSFRTLNPRIQKYAIRVGDGLVLYGYGHAGRPWSPSDAVR